MYSFNVFMNLNLIIVYYYYYYILYNNTINLFKFILKKRGVNNMFYF